MALGGYSCKKSSQINPDSGLKLAFSADTVIFDTVFTYLGSATHELMIYNQHSDDLKISSTQRRKALAAGDIALANRMLGYRYQISGTVVHGREVGRTLHFPTANVAISDLHKMLPADGVYCVETEVEGLSYKAMCNIGTQPTFGSDKRAVEVHLFDFKGDIYGKTVILTFVGKIRDIK